MSETSNSQPPSSISATSALYNWATLYLLMAKDTASNAAAAFVAKVKKWSPLAQISVSLALVLAFAWLFGMLHLPGHETYATPAEVNAAIDKKIDAAKNDLRASFDEQVAALTDAISKLPTDATLARVLSAEEPQDADIAAAKAQLTALAARIAALEQRPWQPQVSAARTKRRR